MGASSECRRRPGLPTLRATRPPNSDHDDSPAVTTDDRPRSMLGAARHANDKEYQTTRPHSLVGEPDDPSVLSLTSRSAAGVGMLSASGALSQPGPAFPAGASAPPPASAPAPPS